MFEKQIRNSVVAGSFYPADPLTLKKVIDEYLENSVDKKLMDIKGLVCPHAGYIYSGPVAAHAYRQLQGKSFDCIFIIAPSHSEYFDFNSVFSGSAYETPLGLIEVDRERADVLVKKSDSIGAIQFSGFGHRREHSLEVQLPFLQVVLKNFKIVPIVMGSQTGQNIKSLGTAIGTLFKDQNILVIASTDLSHYHPYNVARTLDKEVTDFVENFGSSDFDVEKFIEAVESQELEMCGGGPVACVMIASRLLGADKSMVLDYQNSGDVSGDRSAVVGYLAAAFFGC